MKAFIVNRVGDFGFALGIFGVFFLFGSIEFDHDLQRCAVRHRGADGEVITFLGYASRQGRTR
jgi:NADH-quinone oxidoreductase subunit L